MKKLLTAVTFVVAACAPLPQDQAAAPEAEVRLSVDQASYRAGDPLELRLVNGSDRQVGYNLCVSGLDRRANADWVTVPQSLVEACTMELRILEPGASASFRHTLPRDLATGEYRIRTGVESPLGSAQTGLATPGFQVTS